MNENQENTNNTKQTFDRQVRLLDELQSLLAQQLHLACQGDSTEKQFTVLTVKASALVERFDPFSSIGSEEIQHRLQDLRQIYKTLILTLAAEKAGLSEELRRIRWSKKIIAVYHKTT